MGTVVIKHREGLVGGKGKRKSERAVIYEQGELEKFSPEILWLGDIGARSKQIGVIAATFDLSGFTNFCCQVDPHLSMPRFLNEFLEWLFKEIRSYLQVRRLEKGTALYAEVPFFAKFTGDGVLFLWNAGNMNDILICNIILTLLGVCRKYEEDFLPKMKGHLSYLPKRLRCGVACGNVCSVGNTGGDYVGSCINMASRLQGLHGLGFCVSRRGIDFEAGMNREARRHFAVKSVEISGIGEEELVIVDKSGFAELSSKDQGFFEDV